jgi:transposase InsO family protein
VVLGDNQISLLTTNKIPVRAGRQRGAPPPAIFGSAGGGDTVIKDAQVRKLMEEIAKQGKKEVAAIKAGMDPKTARKYRRLGKLPSETKVPHTWQNREDPFAEDWQGIKVRLEDAPELEAKALFEHLMETREGRYEPGHLRTLQRRIKQWRAQEGPPKEVFFAQEHRPGEAMQTDFTWANELGITIGGEPFEHMLCHPVLPYSNWQWATVCHSESTEALRRGVQAAIFQLGRVPTFHQTDQGSAATHSLPSGKREFNDDYLALMRHLGMKPRTIAPGKKEQNGDVESINGALKRRLEQHLLLRGSRDFDSVEEYELWLWQILIRANSLRGERFEEDLEAMKPLSAKRLPEYTRIDLKVSSWSVIKVKCNVYSVPSRLRDEKVQVLLYEDRLEVLHGGVHQLSIERLRGKGGHRINYRHIIWSLVRKPGAFERYKYREDLFPTLAFRLAYDALTDAMASTRRADIEYLRILHLAASTMESEVEVALEILREEGAVPTSDRVKALVVMAEPEVPELSAPTVDLGEYDALLESRREVAS